jgi:DNA-binding transcriptional regulator YiaG
MTAPELRAELQALGLSQRWLAGRLGVAANTVNRWASGELAVPQYAVAYLELLRKVPQRA